MSNTVYDQQYFSGTQACLYIGDVLIDEISSFNFMVNQAKTPIYGYADQLFAKVAPGTVIVSGSFTINFKEANYLYLALMRYQGLMRSIADAATKFSQATGIAGDDRIFGQKIMNIPSQFLPQFGKDQKSREGIESLISGLATTEQRYTFYQQLSSGDQDQNASIVRTLEDSIFGKESKDLDKEVRRTDDNFFDGFDMYLTYGDYSNPEANYTVERLTGVHLTSRGKAVSVSGEPIQEQYQFIARNSY